MTQLKILAQKCNYQGQSDIYLEQDQQALSLIWRRKKLAEQEYGPQHPITRS